MESALKKRYGQHFLRDTGIILRIEQWIGPDSSDLMIEVGAGDGALSIRLAPKVFHLLALEIDPDVLPALTTALRPFPNAEIVAGDVLHMDLPSLSQSHMRPGLRLRFAGNLPYNIGTAIIERLLTLPLPILDMVFMLQWEVAARICAPPGTRDYGFFSVFCRHYCETRMGFKVSPACFVPRPKVTSAMLTLIPRPGPRNPVLEKDFVMLTKAAFSYRRKTLVNSLRRHPRLGAASGELLARAGIRESRRPEDLTVGEYEHLAHVFGEMALPESGAGERTPQKARNCVDAK